MKRLIVAILLQGTTLAAQTDSVTITEVMFDPLDNESTDEYVEIFNYSKTQTYDLTNWIISDNAGGNDSDKIVSAGEGLLLYPGQFGIVLDADYSLLTGLYSSIIPDTARILKISGTTFGNGGLNNSTAERIILIKPAAVNRDTLSAYQYSIDNQEGYADENISLTPNSAVGNWTNSVLLYGTPGAPPTLDLNVANITFNPPSPPSGTAVSIDALVKNTGIRSVESGVLVFYADANRDGIPDDSEILDSTNVPTLARLDSVILSVTSATLPIGTHYFIASLRESGVLPAADTIVNNNRRRDSVTTVPQFDLSLSSTALSFSPAIPSAGDSVAVRAVVTNNGLTAVSSFTVRFYDDRNMNSIPEQAEIEDSITVSASLPSGDSIEVLGTIFDLEYRFYAVIASLDGPTVLPSPDEFAGNDQRTSTLRIGIRPRSLVVNEIYYNAATGQSEWVEIYNRSTDTLDLRNWQVADGNSDQTAFASKRTITSTNFLLAPGEFAVIGKDSVAFLGQFPSAPGHRIFFSNFPTLNNSGDLVGLFDSLGIPSDSLQYLDDWGGASGRSLERRHTDSLSTYSDNWSTSINAAGATPGFVNSISPVPNDLAVFSEDIAISPTFPEKGRVTTISVAIHNLGLMASTPSTVILFADTDNDGLRDMSERVDSVNMAALSSGATTTIDLVWPTPGTAPDSVRLWIVIDYAVDERAENNEAIATIIFRVAAASVVINEILADPGTDQSEFIEITNRSNVPVNLKNWTVRDQTSSKTITPVDAWMASGTYRVLSGDTAITGKLSLPDSLIIFISGMPSLNNDSDDVVLRDGIGATVDSLRYYPGWGGRKAVSIERYSVDEPSTDASNWNASLANGGHTAGQANSLLGVTAFSPGSVIINEIMYAPLSGEAEYIEILNVSDSTQNLLNWSLDIGNSRAILSTADLMIAPGAYLVFTNTGILPSRFNSPAGSIVKPATGLSSLNNNGSAVVLRDLIGTTIDSINYQPQWGGSDGFSLERIRPGGTSNDGNNWGSCVFVEGGTPGRINSIFSETLSSRIRISATPNPFLHDVQAATTIRIDIPISQSRLTVRIYDNHGRLIRTLLNNSPSGSHREITWDGRTKEGTMARMGIYIVFVEAISETPGFHKTAKQTVVLGKRL